MSETNLDKSLDDELSDIYDKMTADPVEDEPEEVEEEEIEAEPEPVDDEPEAEPEPAEEDQEEAEESEPEPVEEVIPDNLRNPPSAWTAANKSKYNELPVWAREQIHKREIDSLNGVNNLKEQASFGDRVSKTVEPYKAFLNSRGIQVEGVVQNALNMAYSLSTAAPEQKAGMIASIARQYGVDLSLLNKPQDPQQAAIQQYLSPLQQEVQNLRNLLNTQTQSSQEQQLHEAQSAIQSFAQTQDESGGLKYPYFDNVVDEMAALLESKRATTLEEAYDRATWSDPSIRQLLRSSQTQGTAAKRSVAKQEHAAKAVKATQTNLRKKGQHDSLQVKPRGTMEDTLNSTYEALMAKG